MIYMFDICYNTLGIVSIIAKEQGKRTDKSIAKYCGSLFTILLFMLLPILFKSIDETGFSIRIGINVVILGILHKLLYKSNTKTGILKGIIIYQLYKAIQACCLFVSYGLGLLTHRENSQLILNIYLYILQTAALFLCGKLISKIDLDKLLMNKKISVVTAMTGIITPIAVATTAFFWRMGNVYLLLVPLVFLINSSLFFVLWLYDKQCEQHRHKKLEEENIRLAAKIHRTKEIIPAVGKELQELDEAKRHISSPHIKQLIKEIEGLQESHIKEKGFSTAGSFIDTGFQLLDRQLENYVAETFQKGIQFTVNLRKKITALSDQTGILQGEIQQIIGDLIRNSIRSIERGEDKAGNILLCFGYVEAEQAYVLEVYDDGIPFPEHILQNIGMRGISTESTGNGLADIKEILSKYGGSLEVEILDEKIYCKAVRIKMQPKSKL